MPVKTSIYDYLTYKQYILDTIAMSENEGRGRRRLLADALSCQVSHITNVLSGTGHFSQEQAEAAARFFGLSFHETEYFLLLVQHNRAGTKNLRTTYDKILKERRTANHQLRDLIAINDQLSESQQAVYYSSWYVGAIHVLLSIPDFQTREAIADRLSLPLTMVDRSLDFLITAGLCKKQGNQLSQLRPLLHLDKTSPLIARHHSNWRLRAIQALDAENSQNLHYSGVFSLSRADFTLVKSILAESLARSFATVKESPEEDMAALSMDLYWL